nr:transposase [Streptomyces roseochromogenus]
MQYAERLCDRQAAEAVRARTDRKYLLGLDLDGSGFDHSLLARLRARLVAHGLEECVLETELEATWARGCCAGADASVSTPPGWWPTCACRTGWS